MSLSPMSPSTPLLPGDAPPTTATTKGACGFVKAPRGALFDQSTKRVCVVVLNHQGAFGLGLWQPQKGCVWVQVKQPGHHHKSVFGWDVKTAGCVGFVVIASTRNLDIIGIQETRLEHVDNNLVRALWGKSDFDFSFRSSRGHSGGTLIIWNTNSFSKVSLFCGSHYCGVIGKFNGISEDVILVNIYAPQSESLKQSLWKELIDLKSKMTGVWIFFGDFNSVRCRLERWGSRFVVSDPNAFNDFIYNAGLMDMQLVTALERVISDQCPIFLSFDPANFSPKPFRFFYSWMEQPGFMDIVKVSWIADIDGNSADVVLKNKLKRLKKDMKDWCSSLRSNSQKRIDELRQNLVYWDVKAEAGHVQKADVV
nr:hypothetical protein [Tanacetum cinerariifolium]